MSKLDGIKAGDRVRVTFEGVVTSLETDHFFPIKFLPDGAKIPSCPNIDTIEADTFQITRIEPAFKVGDRVIYMSCSDESVIVAFLKDGRAVIEYRAGDTTNVRAFDVSCLTRA